MAVFRCGRFPRGEIPIRTARGLVVFTDGQAVVDDPEQAQALREQPAAFEITEDVEEAGAAVHGTASPTPAPEQAAGQPAKSAPKAVWVAWAAAHGMDRETATDLTKAELFELADRLEEE